LTIYETWRSALAKRKIPLLVRRGVPSVSEGRGGCLTNNQPPPPDGTVRVLLLSKEENLLLPGTENHGEICSFPDEMFSYLKFHPDTVILPCGAGRASVAFHVASREPKTRNQIMHSWNLSVKEAINLQKKLSKIVICCGKPERINLIAGVDIAYDKNNNLDFCSIVLLN